MSAETKKPTLLDELAAVVGCAPGDEELSDRLAALANLVLYRKPGSARYAVVDALARVKLDPPSAVAYLATLAAPADPEQERS